MSLKHVFLISVLIAVSFCAVYSGAEAMVLETDPPGYLQTGFDRLDQESRAMWILLGWGSTNVVAGGIFALNEPYRDFGLMTAGWGAVNAAIAVIALTGADHYDSAVSFETVLKDEQFFNRILAVNSGLNAGYITTGFIMQYLGNSSRVRQFGTAVMVQGAFLLGFDARLLLGSNSRLAELAAYPQVVSVITPVKEIFAPGLGISFSF